MDPDETPEGEGDTGAGEFKKRRRRDRGNLKAKTLSEDVTTRVEPTPSEEVPVATIQPVSEDAEEEQEDEDNEEPQEQEEAEAKEAGSDDSDEKEGVSAVVRPRTRPKKPSQFIANTKQKIRELQTHSIASDRSAMPDKSSKSDQFAASVEAVVRDPTKPKWYGPQKQSTARAISRFDYQPDLCKDYNETGYCGYGDSCKFLHDRGDYKTGWQLEKEHEEEQRRKRLKAMGEDVEDEVDYRIDPETEDLPWACGICRGDFVNPVVTQCRHYFCESCALSQYGKGKTRCATCNVQTHGIFNTAHRLFANLEKLKTKREDEVRKAEEIAQQKRDTGSWAL